MSTTIVRVALPTSILSVEHSLLQKSIRIHQVARWTSIFGVYEVVFYKDALTSPDEFREHVRLIEKHWKYFFTPPYLRKLLVPLSPELRYVGFLPPIRLEVFNVKKVPREGEERLGFVFKSPEGILKAYIGLPQVYEVVGECKRINDVVLLKVVSVREQKVQCVEREVYRGPRVVFESSLKHAAEKYRRLSNYIVLTDRKGELPQESSVKLMKDKDITLFFGSPKYDLFELSEKEGFDISKLADYVWNTVPRQKVATVRTEEALIITLGILNMFLKGI